MERLHGHRLWNRYRRRADIWARVGSGRGDNIGIHAWLWLWVGLRFRLWFGKSCGTYFEIEHGGACDAWKAGKIASDAIQRKHLNWRTLCLKVCFQSRTAGAFKPA